MQGDRFNLGWGRSPEKKNGNPPSTFCLETYGQLSQQTTVHDKREQDLGSKTTIINNNLDLKILSAKKPRCENI